MLHFCQLINDNKPLAKINQHQGVKLQNQKK